MIVIQQWQRPHVPAWKVAASWVAVFYAIREYAARHESYAVGCSVYADAFLAALVTSGVEA